MCRDCGEPAIKGQWFCGPCATKARNRTRVHNFTHNYGITEKVFDETLALQKGLCAICGTRLDIARSLRDRGPHVDHDHATGRMRGILCGKCNTGIGMFNDDVSLIRRAGRYLRKSQSSQRGRKR